MLQDCLMSNISVSKLVIFDGATKSTTFISNTEFHILSGSIYQSDHFLLSQINFQNVSIKTNQVTKNYTNPLLWFSLSDHANINQMTILYHYHTEKQCHYGDEAWSSGNFSVQYVVCNNPAMAIWNEGEVY